MPLGLKYEAAIFCLFSRQMFGDIDLNNLKGKSASIFALRVSDIVLGDLPKKYKIFPKKNQPNTRPPHPDEYKSQLEIVKRMLKV